MRAILTLLSRLQTYPAIRRDIYHMDDFKLYTVEEITEILKVTQRTLYNYIKSGSLKAVKIGKYWRVKHTDLQDFLEKGTKN
jgi:excisionase family DNA binding protein